MVGIIEEQHPDRTRLFMQWKKMDWPLLIDSLNLLDVLAVPLTYLIDEAGIVRYERPSDEDLEVFLATDYTHAPERGETLDVAPVTPAGPVSEDSPEHVLLWGGDVSDAIARLLRRVGAEPDNTHTHFRLGVAYRKRYDSDAREPEDFAKAVEHWARALELDPNQYIFRRRIQQYGPRLDKPYPFYDWVPEARAAIEGRGETALALSVEPRGSEFAKPVKAFVSSGIETEPPDPDGRIFRDEAPLIAVETVTVPAKVPPGGSARVHVVLRPDLSKKAHWNNEVDDTVFWVDVPEGWQVDARRHTVSIPPEPVSQEPRHIEFELQTPSDFTGDVTIPAYALYYVCEDVDGTCLFRRQDVEVVVAVRY